MEKRSNKRVSLGVQKKKQKPIKKSNKKTLLNRVIDCLKSDGYMFAPLVSPLPFGFEAPKIGSFSATGVEVAEPSEGKDKRLLKKVDDYLKFDSYMYAPLVASRQLGFSDIGPSQYVKMVTTEISVRTTVKCNQTTAQSANAIAEDSPFESSLPDASVMGRQLLGHKETVKHTVYQTCRSSSVSGKEMLNSQLRF